MEPAHERTLRRLVRQLQKDPRGAFIIIACADPDLRTAIERSLDESLPELELGRLEWSDHPISPWDEIVDLSRQLGGRAVISIHYDAIEPGVLNLDNAEHLPPEIDRVAILRFNLGRDIRTREGISLLLWVRGPGPLEALRINTPDIWAHRTLATHFPSAADFPALESAVFAAENMSAEQAITENLKHAELDWLSASERIYKLSFTALLLSNTDQIEKMRIVVTKMQRIYDENPDLAEQEQPTWELWMRKLMLAARQENWPQFGELSEEISKIARTRKWTLLRDLSAASRGRAAQNCGFSIKNINILDERLRMNLDPSLNKIHNALTIIYTDFAEFFLLNEDPIRAISKLEKAAETTQKIPDRIIRYHSWVRIGKNQAKCAILLGRTDEALRWAWRATRLMQHTGLWDQLRDTFAQLRRIYTDTGIPGLVISELLAEANESEKLTPSIRGEIQAHLAQTYSAIGSPEKIEHAKSYLDTQSSVTHLHPPARILQCSIFARAMFTHRDNPAELERWHREIDNHLSRQPDDDSRDRLLLERARWHLLADEPEHAVALAEDSLSFRRTERGPSMIADSCIIAARGHCRLGSLDRAKDLLTEAREVLKNTREEARPFDSYKDVMLETAKLAIAQEDPDAAWQAISDALAFATQRHLKVERMRLLLEQARLELGSERGQEAAAQSLQIANEIGYLRDEGQIRLVLAMRAQQAGDLDEARTELREARWLLEKLGPPEQRDEARALAELLTRDNQGSH